MDDSAQPFSLASMSDEDIEFVSMVHREFCEDRAEKEKYSKNWDRWRHYRDGDQWMYKMRPAWKALPVMNYSASIIRSIVPEITANNPSVNIMSIKPGREGVADILQADLRNRLRTLIVAHKDRLARFGFELLQHLCREHGCDLLVINSEKLSPEQEMVQDLMTIVHCFSSRLCGLRNYKKTLKEALENKPHAADAQDKA